MYLPNNTIYTLYLASNIPNILFFLFQISDSSQACESSGPKQRRRWARRIGSTDLMVKSMLDLRQLEYFAKSSVMNRDSALHNDLDLGSTISLQTIAAWVNRYVHFSDSLVTLKYLNAMVKNTFALIIVIIHLKIAGKHLENIRTVF